MIIRNINHSIRVGNTVISLATRLRLRLRHLVPIRAIRSLAGGHQRFEKTAVTLIHVVQATKRVAVHGTTSMTRV